MRLIFGFIFFGLLFYGIYLYAPDTFQTLVSWAARVFEFFQDLFHRVSRERPVAPSPETLPKSPLALLGIF
jgi:hypothetical protein